MADKKYYSEEKVIRALKAATDFVNNRITIEELSQIRKALSIPDLTIPESEVTAYNVFRKHWKNHKVDRELLLSTEDQNMIEASMEEYRVLSFAKAQKIDDYKELYEQGLVIINELSKQNDGLQLLIDEKQKVKLPSDDEMVSKMGKIAHERSSSHNNQYGAYKMGFRDCYEWMLDQIKKQIEK